MQSHERQFNDIPKVVRGVITLEWHKAILCWKECHLTTNTQEIVVRRITQNGWVRKQCEGGQEHPMGGDGVMIQLQVHLQLPCYDFFFL